MRLILSILMLVAVVAGFAFFIVPHYNSISALRAQQADYETILTNARQLKQESNALVTKYNSFDPVQLGELTTMLPSNPENMKLILALQNVASQNGMVLQNVKIDDPDVDAAAQNSRPGAGASSDLGTLTIDFSMAGPYASFTSFIKTIERSLRMLEIQKVSFAVSDPKSQSYQYTVSIKTYWLK